MNYFLIYAVFGWSTYQLYQATRLSPMQAYTRSDVYNCKASRLKVNVGANAAARKRPINFPLLQLGHLCAYFYCTSNQLHHSLFATAFADFQIFLIAALLRILRLIK